MANQTPLEATIAEVAQAPQSATTDNTSVTERPAADLIALDQHLAGNQALRKPGFGIMRQKIRRGSALG